VTYLPDTNVLSELRRRAPNPSVLRWFDATRPTELYLSVIVVGEIRQGVERLRPRDPARSEHLEAWLHQLQESFVDRILEITMPIAEAWGRLRAPRPLPVVDGILAATALVHGLTVVTRDTAPFERIGVPYLDPWTYGEP
jgi:predicted nucleic acid-binding protein